MSPQQEKITVLLADDHRLVRLGFRRMLEDEPDIEVVGEADNGLQAIELAEKLRPAVAVVDMSMPELDGVQAIHEIGRRAPETRVLVLSMYDERSYIRNALKAGALGYVLKNAIDVDLVSAVKVVAGRADASSASRFRSRISRATSPTIRWNGSRSANVRFCN